MSSEQTPYPSSLDRMRGAFYIEKRTLASGMGEVQTPPLVGSKGTFPPVVVHWRELHASLADNLHVHVTCLFSSKIALTSREWASRFRKWTLAQTGALADLIRVRSSVRSRNPLG